MAELEIESAALFESETEIKAWGDYKRHKTEWRAEWENLRALSRQSSQTIPSGDHEAAEDLARQAFSTASFEKFHRTLDDAKTLSDYNKTEATRVWETNKKSNQQAQVALICGLIAAILLFAALVFIVIAQFMILATNHPETAPQI